jgi:hypothetical protein
MNLKEKERTCGMYMKKERMCKKERICKKERKCKKERICRTYIFSVRVE